MNARVKEALDNYIQVISAFDGVVQIYLFGSLAYGMPNEQSDIDLMVIVEDQLKTIKIAYAINVALIGKKEVPLDILVNRQSDFWDAVKDPSLQRRIIDEGVLVYGK